MNIVMFGASGMIGLYLTDALLAAEHHVIAAGRNPRMKPYFDQRHVPYIKVDISCPEDFEKLPSEKVDVVVHLAAIMPAAMRGYSPRKYIEINTLGTLHVLEYCKRVGAKQIIYTQSHSDVGGYWGQPAPIDPYVPYSIRYGDDHTVYIISKIAALELIKHYQAAYNIGYAVFRCPNIYSYYPNKYYFVDGKPCEVGYRKLMDQAMQSKPIEIWGACQTKKDIVYVKDLTQMICKAIDKKIQHGIYNVSTGEATSLQEQVLGIVQVFSPAGKPSVVSYRPDKKVRLNNHHYSIENARKDLGYEPQYSYIDMLLDLKKEMEGHRFDCITEDEDKK